MAESKKVISEVQSAGNWTIYTIIMTKSAKYLIWNLHHHNQLFNFQLCECHLRPFRSQPFNRFVFVFSEIYVSNGTHILKLDGPDGNREVQPVISQVCLHVHVFVQLIHVVHLFKCTGTMCTINLHLKKYVAPKRCPWSSTKQYLLVPISPFCRKRHRFPN